jgi:hypothetical protein
MNGLNPVSPDPLDHFQTEVCSTKSRGRAESVASTLRQETRVRALFSQCWQPPSAGSGTAALQFFNVYQGYVEHDDTDLVLTRGEDLRRLHWGAPC